MNEKGDTLSFELKKYLEKTANIRYSYIEKMAAAYLKDTNIHPDNVKLVEMRSGDKTEWWFELR